MRVVREGMFVLRHLVDELYYGTDEALFVALKDAIKQARSTPKRDWSHVSDRLERENLERLCRGGLLMVTLTKGLCCREQQLRIWVRNPWFQKGGRHVDHLGACGIFEAYGHGNVMSELVEKHFCERPFGITSTRFENGEYIIWV